MPHVFKITPMTQSYDWGKRGSSAKVAQFAQSSGISGFAVDEDKPYAELWMGTHPSSPSRVKETGEILSDYLAKNTSFIGQGVISKFPDAAQGNLPFLFKVLSIAKALSIQSHPDKQTARILHERSPQIYKDPNHKPEMALALTPFEALCGFRPLPDIARHLRATPELASLIPGSILETFYSAADEDPTGTQRQGTKALRDVFEAIMTAPPERFSVAITSIIERYGHDGGAGVRVSNEPTSSSIPESLVSLIQRLNTQYPSDVGVLCPYLLNYICLEPGQAIFLGAGEPHAYVSGEAIECMANSDNVIRAGLTPKLRDVENLVKGLTYIPAEGKRHYVQPTVDEGSKEGGVLLYDPPIEEFSVWKIEASGGSVSLRGVDGPSVAIVTGGEGVLVWSENGADNELTVGTGDVVFVAASTPVTVKSSSEKESIELYSAFVEVSSE